MKNLTKRCFAEGYKLSSSTGTIAMSAFSNPTLSGLFPWMGITSRSVRPA